MQIHVALQEKALWRQFDAQQNEMIITKIGRNLFPILEFVFKGISEHSNYRIGITMEPLSLQKLKYTAGRWEPLDVVEEIVQSNEVFLVKSGRELLQRGLKLDKLKLTNSKDAAQKNTQMIRIQSMRMYIPVLNVYEVLSSGAAVLIGKFQFQETKFIAVTAYQSEQVKQLKVQKNKFAQGFREGVKVTTSPNFAPISTPSGIKRPKSTTSSNSSPDSTLSDSNSNQDFLGPATKKERGPELQYPQENIPPSSYYQFQMQNFQNFQPNFQNFDFGGANYWQPQAPPTLQYDFGGGGSTTVASQYGYQWN